MAETVSTPVRHRTRAFLLEPLGWVGHRLSHALHKHPEDLSLLLGVGGTKIHLIALVLAHRPEDKSYSLTRSLLAQSEDDLLKLLQVANLPSLKPTLLKLPNVLLPAKNYRMLLALMRDGNSSLLLKHSGSIDEAIIRSMHNLPEKLRTHAIMLMLQQVGRMDLFSEGLRFLSDRADSSLAALVTRLGSLGQPEQIASSIRRLVESLPLPVIAPPAQIKSFRRVDAPRELRNLAKVWRNCLADCVLYVDEGTSVIYLSEHLKAICLVTRHGRLGWFLDQSKGPRNAEIEPHVLAQLRKEFAVAGIFDSAIIEAIKTIINTREWRANNHRCTDVFEPLN